MADTVFSKPVDDEVASLSGKITTLETVYSVVLKATATTTATDFNTYDGRKFSDFKILFFVLHDNAYSASIRKCETIPSTLWTSGAYLYLIQNHGASLENRSGVTFQYKSDTSVTATLSGAGLLTGFEILGILKD